MKHIKTPVRTEENEGSFSDLDNDGTEFKCIIIADQDEQICLVPTDLKPEPEQIAAELVQAVNAYDGLVYALKRAEQTVRNLGQGWLDGDGQTIALNEARNIRAILAKVEGQ